MGEKEEAERQMLWSERTGQRTSLVVQWLRLCAPIAGGPGSIPGQGTKIPHATWLGQKQKDRSEFMLVKFPGLGLG